MPLNCCVERKEKSFLKNILIWHGILVRFELTYRVKLGILQMRDTVLTGYITMFCGQVWLNRKLSRFLQNWLVALVYLLTTSYYKFLLEPD